MDIMDEKDSAQNVISTYRKRQSLAHRAPLIFGIAAVLLIIGAGILIFWLTNPKPPSITFFPATSTTTATSTATLKPTLAPTNTPTVTITPEPTQTSTVTETPTAASAFIYKVQEGDSLSSIAQKFGTKIELILALNPNITDATKIYVGQEIIIPAPNMTLPTATPIPTNWVGIIPYLVQKDDTLSSIAEKFNSTVESIMQLNKDILKNENDVPYGITIKVKVNIYIRTPVPTVTKGTIYPTAPLPQRTHLHQHHKKIFKDRTFTRDASQANMHSHPLFFLKKTIIVSTMVLSTVGRPI